MSIIVGLIVGTVVGLMCKLKWDEAVLFASFGTFFGYMIGLFIAR